MARKRKHTGKKKLDKLSRGIRPPEPTNPPKGEDVIHNTEDENELPIEVVLNNADPEGIKSQLSEFTSDPQIIDDFADRQDLNTGGRSLLDQLEEHTMESPEDSAGDIDAAWDSSNALGDEALGGDSPTPDQDVVDELGDAAGITYGLEEPLDADKLNERDRKRWELNPESADDTDFTNKHKNVKIVDDQDVELDEDIGTPKPQGE